MEGFKTGFLHEDDNIRKDWEDVEDRVDKDLQ